MILRKNKNNLRSFLKLNDSIKIRINEINEIQKHNKKKILKNILKKKNFLKKKIFQIFQIFQKKVVF